MTKESKSEVTFRDCGMAELYEWLSRDSWTVVEAATILAGITPNSTNCAQSSRHLEFLPGGRRPHWIDHDGTFDIDGLAELLGEEQKYLEQMTQSEGSATIKSPRQWILHAKKWNYEPPWLPIILDEHNWRQLLPAKSEVPSELFEKVDSSQSRGGKGKAEASIGADVKRAIRDRLLEWHAKPAHYQNRAEFLKDMRRQYEDPDGPTTKDDSDYDVEHPTVRSPSTIRKYVNQLIEDHGTPKIE